MNRFLASVPSPSHELRPQLWLSHCISRIPEFNPLVRVLSSAQLTIKPPHARRGVGATLLHSPHFIHTSPFTPFHSAGLTNPPVPHLPFQLTLAFFTFGHMAFCACKHTRLARLSMQKPSPLLAASLPCACKHTPFTIIANHHR